MHCVDLNHPLCDDLVCEGGDVVVMQLGLGRCIEAHAIRGCEVREAAIHRARRVERRPLNLQPPGGGWISCGRKNWPGGRRTDGRPGGARHPWRVV